MEYHYMSSLYTMCLKNTAPFWLCNNSTTSTDFSNHWHSDTWVNFQQLIWDVYCPLHLICVPTLTWKSELLSNFNVTGTFISTKLLLFSIPMHNTCVNAHVRQLEHFLPKLSSFVSVSDIILLQLSEFHVNHVNDCLYCISCMVCYKVGELRSRYGAKLQHVLFTFPSGVFLQKNVKIGLENKVLLK